MTITARPKLAVIVVNYNSSSLLATNLRAVSREIAQAEIVVVDNFTSVAEQEITAGMCEHAGWIFVPTAKNLGFGAGMNLGVAAAVERGARAFLLLNPDATIDATSVELLLDRAVADQLALIAPTVVTPSGAPWFTGADLHLRFGRSRATRHRSDYPGERFQPWLSGACLLITEKLWTRLGGFDERYFLYWEDIDLSVRAVHNGGSLALVEEAIAVHDEGGTHEVDARGSGRGKSSVYYYYNIRNRLLFAARHLDGADRRRWLVNSPLAAWDVLLQGGRRQLLHSTKPLSAAVRGTVAGLLLYAGERVRSSRSGSRGNNTK